MIKILLSINLILYGLVAIAQPDSIKNLNTPEMKFKTEIIDYGTIEKGANAIREFYFTNTGNAPLIISDVKRSCGCTIPSWPKEPIQPDKTSIIYVKYDTKRVGIINKSISIISNAKRPTIVLQIKGKVIETNSIPLVDQKGKQTAK
jgi:hypothetical protein